MMNRAGLIARVLLFVLAATLAIFLPQRVAAQTVTMDAALALSQAYRPNSWQPIRIDVKNDSDRAIDGTAALALADPTAPALMKLPLSVPAHSRVRATIFGYFPARAVA